MVRLPATITAIEDETPTIKSFTLDLDRRELGFKAGQWIDFFVTLEGAEAVGGYSITSSPAVQDRIGMAVKREDTEHPVTDWLHRAARVGDRVDVNLGGDFTYTPDEADSVALIGGGIGLTPLMSIVRSVDELAARTDLTLVYSASSPDEILFHDELEAIALRNPRVRCVFTITGSAPESWHGHTGRIDARLLDSESIDLAALFLVCGPPTMIRDINAMLVGLGVPEARIRYEQWW